MESSINIFYHISKKKDIIYGEKSFDKNQNMSVLKNKQKRPE